MSSEIKVEFVAETAKLAKGADEAKSVIEEFNQAASKVGGDAAAEVDKINSSFRGMAADGGGASSFLMEAGKGMAAIAASAATAYFALKPFVDAAAQNTLESMKLGRALGISAQQAEIWRTAAENAESSMGELEAASRGLTMSLASNESGLNKMGVATRDANGALLGNGDIMMSAIEAVNSYREGTDRNLAAQEIFGRSVRGSSQLLTIQRGDLKGVADQYDDLGVAVTAAAEEAYKKFDTASDNLNLSLKQTGRLIGQTLIPAFTDLANAANSTVPAAMEVLRAGLWVALGVIFTLRSATILLVAGLVQLAEAFVMVSQATEDVLTLNFDDLKSNWATSLAYMSKVGKDALKEVREGAEQTVASLAALHGEGGKPIELTPPRVGKGYTGPAEESTTTSKTVDSPEKEKTRDTSINSSLLDDDLREIQQRIATRTRAAEIMAQIERSAQLAIQDEIIKQAQFERSMGLASSSESVERIRAAEQAKLAILIASANEQLMLAGGDEVAYAQALQAKEQATLAHGAIMSEMSRQQAQEFADNFSAALDPIANAFDKTATGLIQGTLTWRDATRGILRSIAAEYAVLAVRTGIDMAKAEAVKTAAVHAGAAKRLVIETASSIKSFAITAAMAIKKIAIYAFEAAAAAFVAVAGIPIIGPVLAVAAAGAALAFVGGLASKIGGGGGGSSQSIGGGSMPSAPSGSQQSGNIAQDGRQSQLAPQQTINMTVYAKDADSFRKSNRQIKDDLGGMLPA